MLNACMSLYTSKPLYKEAEAFGAHLTRIYAFCQSCSCKA